MNLHFIKAGCHQSNRKQGYQFAPDRIKQNYDYEIKKELFSGSKIDFENGHKISTGYELLYKYILRYNNNNTNTNNVNNSDNDDSKIITIGGDGSISAATISAINEKYIYKNGEKYSSKLKILWIDCFPDIDTFITSSTKNLNEMPLASLLGLCNPSLAPTKLIVDSSQIIFYGILDDYVNNGNSNDNLLYELNSEIYTVNKIKKIKCDIIKTIKESIDDSPVHVVIDMKAFSPKFAPSVDPVNKNGLDDRDVLDLLAEIKNNVVSMDIVEFNPLISNEKDAILTTDIAQKCIIETFDIKSKSLNIFNEFSYFLIYRPTKKESPEDYGWYILKNINNDDKEKIMKSIDDDTIITLDIDDDEYLITKTTMNEQNNKSYYATVKITDTVLFPNEKISMAFELINPINL